MDAKDVHPIVYGKGIPFLTELGELKVEAFGVRNGYLKSWSPNVNKFIVDPDFYITAPHGGGSELELTVHGFKFTAFSEGECILKINEEIIRLRDLRYQGSRLDMTNNGPVEYRTAVVDPYRFEREQLEAFLKTDKLANLWRPSVKPKRTHLLNEIKDIPVDWRAALDVIKLYHPDAVMAGGCLRDRDNGVTPVKDIDIFVRVSRDSKSDVLDRFIKSMANEQLETKTIDTMFYSQWGANRILGVVNVDFPRCPTVQVVFGDWSEDIKSDFDFGICQITFDGLRLSRSKYYDEDFQIQKFRIIPQQGRVQINRSVKRFANIFPRYPDWKFDVGTASAS